MHKLILFSAFFLVFSSFSAVKGENEIVHDYITSGYFQLIHQADIAYLEGDYDLAFALLQEAERRMPLTNQFFETDLYIWLLIKNGQYDRAIYYMEYLAVNYGGHPVIRFRLDNNPDIRNRFVENNPDFFDVTFPALVAKSEDFYTPERLELIQLLTKMTYHDQRVRTQPGISEQEFFEVDSINRIKFLEIVKKHGFPNARMFGSRSEGFRLHSGIRAMIMHFSDCKEVQEILFHYVRMGQASPSLYGTFIDRRMMHQRKPFIYAGFSNITDDQIYDVENVDKRRLAVGMPTREQERRRRELLDVERIFSEIGYHYITSGYFQVIYHADIAYLEGNYDFAFRALQVAKKLAPLINQFTYREIELYAWLLIKNGQYEKAFYYMEYLAVNYGQHPFAVTRRFYDNPDIKSRFLENNPDFFETTFPALVAKEESFYTPERLELIRLLTEMTYNDQRVRTDWPDVMFQNIGHLDDEERMEAFQIILYYGNRMNRMDSINRVKFLEIVEKHGFPNKRIFGSRDLTLYWGVHVMIAHFSDDLEIQEMLGRFVRMGKASPSLYGFFVDRRMSSQGKPLIYGVFSNVADDRIYDVENVDKRRTSIGMPTRELERRRRELFDERRRQQAD